MPALALSLLLVAVGLILAFAIEASVAGVDIVAVGIILAVVGLLGVVLSLLFMMSLMPWGSRGHGDDHAHDRRL